MMRPLQMHDCRNRIEYVSLGLLHFDVDSRILILMVVSDVCLKLPFHRLIIVNRSSPIVELPSCASLFREKIVPLS